MALHRGLWPPTARPSLLDHGASTEPKLMLLQDKNYKAATRATSRGYKLPDGLVRGERSTIWHLDAERESICASRDHSWRIFQLISSRSHQQGPTNLQAAQVWLQLFEDRWFWIWYRLNPLHICPNRSQHQQLKSQSKALPNTRPRQRLFLRHLLWLLAEEIELRVDHRPPKSGRSSRSINQVEDKQHWYRSASLLQGLLSFRFNRSTWYDFKEEFEFYSRIWMHQSPRATCFLFSDSEIKDQWQNGKYRTLYFPKCH